jgi:class 3 adenylate cyclase
MPEAETPNQTGDSVMLRRLSLAVIFFSDLVDSTKLKAQVGERRAGEVIMRHHEGVRILLKKFPGGQEIETAGDQFLLLFSNTTDATQFALRLHAQNRHLTEELKAKVLDRIGIHIGEIALHDTRKPGMENTKVFGSHVDLAARIQSLADGGHTLMSGVAYENAKMMLGEEGIPGLGEIAWVNHGPYQLKGVPRPVSICEVGEIEHVRFAPPPDTEKCQRVLVDGAPLPRSGPGAEKAELRIPNLFLKLPQFGQRLRLVPERADTVRELWFVSGPEFKVGKNHTAPDGNKENESDWIAWFWPRSPENDEKTRQISRVHVILGWLDAGLAGARDNRSKAGSFFDGVPLASNEWMPIKGPGQLRIGADYILDLKIFPSALAGEPPVKNLKSLPGLPQPVEVPVRGAITLRPTACPPSFRESYWVLTDATFGADEANPIHLAYEGLAPVQGRVHHFRGCFWLEAIAANDALQVNRSVLHPGELVPLMTDQTVRLGPNTFKVTVVS